MQASTLKDAAGTVGGTVSDLARSVAEITPDVTSKAGDVANKVGDTALKLAALTPWVEEATNSRSMRRWILTIGAVLAVLGLIGWWQKSRQSRDVGATGAGYTATDAERHLKAAAGS
jgi:hypothetical protein